MARLTDREIFSEKIEMRVDRRDFGFDPVLWIVLGVLFACGMIVAFGGDLLRIAA